MHQGAAGVFAVCNKNFLEHSNERRQKENSQLSEASPFEPTSKPREQNMDVNKKEKKRVGMEISLRKNKVKRRKNMILPNIPFIFYVKNSSI